MTATFVGSGMAMLVKCSLSLRVEIYTFLRARHSFTLLLILLEYKQTTLLYHVSRNEKYNSEGEIEIKDFLTW